MRTGTDIEINYFDYINFGYLSVLASYLTITDGLGYILDEIRKP